MNKKFEIPNIKEYKLNNQKLTMLTAYDYRTAQLLDKNGVNLILVGDSVANVFAGLEKTQYLTLDNIIYHLQAVKRGVKHASIVCDMPFGSAGVSIQDTVKNAMTLIHHGADAVKIEGASAVHIVAIEELTSLGIPVISHLGYLPQSENLLGTGKIQGKNKEQQDILLGQAKYLEQAGAQAIVLELIPEKLAKKITKALDISTIGIGAGDWSVCDGQVLVTDDILGKFDWAPKFARQYANLTEITEQAIQSYIKDVTAIES